MMMNSSKSDEVITELGVTQCSAGFMLAQPPTSVVTSSVQSLPAQRHGVGAASALTAPGPLAATPT